MKGMLTGPVTILNWSFPREDLSREIQCQHIALTLRDEVMDLEKLGGVKAVQVDEPALREGVSGTFFCLVNEINSLISFLYEVKIGIKI